MAKCPKCGHEFQTETPAPDGFEEWWTIAPNKVSKGAARRAYSTALKKTSKETLLATYRRFAESCKGADHKFTPHPSSWLGGERWLEWGTVQPDKPNPNYVMPDGWGRYGEKLAERVGMVKFQSWFHDTSLVMLPESIITVKTAFVKSWLTRHYSQDIHAIIGKFSIVVKG